MAEKQYLFKNRLSYATSFAKIAEAVRTLGYQMKIEKRGVNITWEEPSVIYPGKNIYHSQLLIDVRVPDWLNDQLEKHGLLKPMEPEI